VLAPADRIVY